MKAKEEYETRIEMVQMHKEFIEKMDDAFEKRRYVETVWYCYAIFEQRTSRLIAKYLDKYPVPHNRKDNKSAAISTRIKCIMKLIDARYGTFELFDKNLLENILKWCENRNELVHGLISLKHYKRYDDEFKELAECGRPLVHTLYKEITEFRNSWYVEEEPLSPFPHSKCKCKSKKCINPKII